MLSSCRCVRHGERVAAVRAPQTQRRQILWSLFSFVDGILKADAAAIGTATDYDDAYFARFEVAARPVLERRLGDSITAVASLITQAWEQAGKPEMPLNPPRTVRKRRVPPAP